jgi:hypothetical protein
MEKKNIKNNSNNFENFKFMEKIFINLRKIHRLSYIYIIIIYKIFKNIIYRKLILFFKYGL